MICEECGQEMQTAESCLFGAVILNGKKIKRETFGFIDEEGGRCGDCGILMKEGNIHHFGCDRERCPVCGGQFIGCECFGKNVELEKTRNMVER